MQHPPKLIAFGDSGLFGWGDTEAGGWVERLRRHWMLRSEAPVIYNLGVRGDGLERLAARFTCEFNVRGELRRQQPQGMLLAIGLNDTARVGSRDGRPQLAPDAFLFGFSQLLQRASQLAPVFVLGLTPVNEAAMPFAGCLWYSNRDVAHYNLLLEEACLNQRVPFLRLWSEYSGSHLPNQADWSQRLGADGLHCNSEGHSWIFEQVSSWSELLGWAGLPPEGLCRLRTGAAAQRL